MPYSTIADLPKAQTDQYTEHQKRTFLEAFNSAYERYDHDEGHAFAIAHTAAKKVDDFNRKLDSDIAALFPTPNLTVMKRRRLNP